MLSTSQIFLFTSTLLLKTFDAFSLKKQMCPCATVKPDDTTQWEKRRPIIIIFVIIIVIVVIIVVIVIIIIVVVINIIKYFDKVKHM